MDQVTLRTLHEQLSTEYEELKHEEEQLKKVNRDLRSEIRTLKDENDNNVTKITSLELEKETLHNDSKNLGNLRAEHSKLKVKLHEIYDFF